MKPAVVKQNAKINLSIITVRVSLPVRIPLTGAMAMHIIFVMNAVLLTQMMCGAILPANKVREELADNASVRIIVDSGQDLNRKPLWI